MIKNHLIPFAKMQTLGNDFVIMDLRDTQFILTSTLRANITNRRLGIGADQLITLHKPLEKGADIAIEVSNSDGSISGAWGNSARCVAGLLFKEKGVNTALIETSTGNYEARILGGEVGIKFENPIFEWDQIPLSEATDTLYAPIDFGPLKNPTILTLATTHMVFFVSQIDHIPLDYLGSHLENHPLFPKRTNIGLVEPYGNGKLRVRVWERGSGITPGCGSGASAAALASIRRGICKEGEEIECLLDGGVLRVTYQDSTLWLKGEVTTIFTGVVDLGIWG